MGELNIVIVGGGTCGMYLANKLSKHYKVKVLETSKEVVNERFIYNDNKIYNKGRGLGGTSNISNIIVSKPSISYINKLSKLLNDDIHNKLTRFYTSGSSDGSMGPPESDLYIGSSVNRISNKNLSEVYNFTIGDSLSRSFECPLLINDEDIPDIGSNTCITIKETIFYDGKIKFTTNAYKIKETNINKEGPGVEYITGANVISLCSTKKKCRDNKIKSLKYYHNGCLYETKPDIVILCAGVLGTPEILQNSGINDDSPGKNLIYLPGESYDISWGVIDYIYVGGYVSVMGGDRDVYFRLYSISPGKLKLDYYVLRNVREGYINVNQPFINNEVYINDIIDTSTKSRFLKIMEDTLVAYSSVNSMQIPSFIYNRGIIMGGVGTCAMKRVINTDYLVNNYDNLYICDASILPEHPDSDLIYILLFMSYLLYKQLKPKVIKEECSV